MSAPRITALIDPRSIRLRMSGEMIDMIDQTAVETPEATRSAIIRLFCREGLQRIEDEKEKNRIEGLMPGKLINR